MRDIFVRGLFAIAMAMAMACAGDGHDAQGDACSAANPCPAGYACGTEATCQADGVGDAGGLDGDGGPATLPDRFAEGAEPWRLLPGESLLDDVPAGVPIVDAASYSTSTNLATVLQAVEDAEDGAVYVRLAAGTYTIETFRSYGADSWIGFANGRRRVMGLISAGPPGTASATTIEVVPTAVNDSPGARDYALAATGASGPVPIGALYFSNKDSDAPLFFSGLTFRGTLQTPFGVYSEASQAHFRKHQDVASPLPWRGIAIWRAIAGARMQFCRFEGFGFTLNSAPPFETGAIDTNYDDGLVIYRSEIDGRLAAELDPERPVASGGLMWNKGLDTTVQDSWLHHTRRSGFATNTNTKSTAEAYEAIDFQVEEIANTDDGWAGDNGFFNGSNVEGVVGTFTYERARMDVAQGSHIAWAVPYSGTAGVYVSPTTPTIIVRGFTSDDEDYGGNLRISVSKQPNSTGLSPVWTRVSTLGIAGSNLFDVEDAAGVPMTGIRHTEWNARQESDGDAAQAFPASAYFVVTYAD